MSPRHDPNAAHRGRAVDRHRGRLGHAPPVVKRNGPTHSSPRLDDVPPHCEVQAGERDKLDSAGNPLKGADGKPVTEGVEYCTDLVRPDTQQALTLKIVEAGSYAFEAQDEAGATKADGSVLVP